MRKHARARARAHAHAHARARFYSVRASLLKHAPALSVWRRAYEAAEAWRWRHDAAADKRGCSPSRF